MACESRVGAEAYASILGVSFFVCGWGVRFWVHGYINQGYVRVALGVEGLSCPRLSMMRLAMALSCGNWGGMKPEMGQR